MHLNENWNVISRTIIPLISQPDPLRDSSTNGIGDITQSLFLSPAHPGELIWGVGPVFTVPSASDPILGTGKVLFGPTAVFLMTPGHWVLGVLLNNQWSVGGNPLRPAVNTGLAQKPHRDLVAEHAPSGVHGEHIVMNMARLIWRNDNLGTLCIAERAQSRCSAIYEKLNAEFSIRILGAAKREENMQAAEDQARKELGDMYELVELGEAATIDGLTRELDVKERLDGLVEKCLKRLLLVRGLKSISAPPPSAPPRRIPGP
jgi:hypothetical protein